MTHLPTVLTLLAATTKKSSSLLPLILLVGLGVLAYFFFLRPQQRKAQAARQGGGNKDIEVGDEVQTIGGVIGTVLEIHGDRYTLLTGNVGGDGNLDGPQPTRIVFIRQAIAKKVERIADIEDDDVAVDDQPEDHDGVTDVSDVSDEPDVSDVPDVPDVPNTPSHEEPHGRAPKSFDIGGDDHEHVDKGDGEAEEA